MNQQTVIADIERRARMAHVSIANLCRRVGINPSTFWRWKQTRLNPEPTGASLITVGEIFDELERIEAENRRSVRRSGRAAA